jgi:hypothetical protein
MKKHLYPIVLACALFSGIAALNSFGQPPNAAKPKPAAGGTPASTAGDPGATGGAAASKAGAPGATGGSGGAPKPAPATCPVSTGSVAYADLKNKKVTLPYGASFNLTGAASDVVLTGSSQTMDKVLNLQTVSGTYTVSPDGTTSTFAPSSPSGSNWTLIVGKLAPDSSVTFNFQFTGTPVAGSIEAAANEMFSDPAFQTALTQFRNAATGKVAPAVLVATVVLAQAATDVLTAHLAKDGLTPKDPAALKSALNTWATTNIEPLYNALQDGQNLQKTDDDIAIVLGATAAADRQALQALSMEDLHARLKAVTDYSKLPNANRQQNEKQTVDTFIQEYEFAILTLQSGLKSLVFTGASGLAVGTDSDSDVSCDLLKYAGFDVGALYSWRLSELRSFAMIHIYLGPIQMKTIPLAGANIGFMESLRQRTSLAFGMALKDISGSTNSKISGENAFAYGIGFRINKYFRISAGGLLYRTKLPAVTGTSNAANGTLRNEIFIGPSIDITALPALQSILAKAKSN